MATSETPELRILIALERAGGPGSEWTATLMAAVNGEPAPSGTEQRGPADAPGPLLEEIALELDEEETRAIVGARKQPPAVESTHRRRPH